MNIVTLIAGVVGLTWVLAVLSVVLVIVRTTRNQSIR
jgi:hypothetical protein